MLWHFSQTKMKTSIIILAVVSGIFIATTGFLSYDLYTLNKTVSEDHGTLSQVVTFLQNATKQSQAQATPTPVK